MPEEQPAEEQPQEIRVRFNWRHANETPFYVANQFLFQFVGDGYLLSFGQARPPALLNPTREEMEAVEEVAVNVLGSVSLTPERASALMLLLRRQLARFSPDLLEESTPEVEAE